MKTGSLLRGGGMAAVSLVALVLAVPAALAGGGGQLAQASAATYAFAIPAKPLAQALDDFGRVTGLSVVYTTGAPSALTAPAVSGNLTATQALQRLLAGSGLTWRSTDANTVTLEKAAADGAMTLDPVTVEGRLGTSDLFAPGRSEGNGTYTTKSMNSATNMNLAAKDTPQSVSVATRQFMDDAGLNSISEVLNTTTGITVQNFDSDRYNFMARGFVIGNIRHDGQTLSYDGVYQEGITQSDMAIYDRVEIVRGATGLMTGAGEPSAAVNLVRKKPLKERTASVTATVGSWDLYRGEGDVSTPLTEDGRVRARLVAALEDKESYMDRHHIEKQVVYGVIEADLTPSTLLTAGVDYQKTKPEGSSWGGFPLFYSNGKQTDFDVSENPGTDWSSWEQYTQTTFASLDHQFDNRWKVRLAYNLLRNGYDALLGSAGSGFPDESTGTGMSIWEGHYEGDRITHGVEADVSGPFQLFGREHEMMAGFSGSWSKMDGPQYTVAGPYDTTVPNYFTWNGNLPKPSYYQTGSFQSRTDQVGGYAAARLRLADPLSAIVGGRVSSWKTSYFSEDAVNAWANSAYGYEHSGVLTPYAGLVYEVTPQVSVYASYTDIFNPQNARDVTGAYLDPIEGANYEAGVKGEFNQGRLNASAAVFKIQQDNLAETDPSGALLPDGSAAYIAVSGAVTKGFELEVSGAVAEGWNVFGGFTRQISEDADGNRINSTVAQNLLRLYTTCRLPGDWSRLTVGGGVNWQSEMYADVTSPTGTLRYTQEAYAVVNLMARYDITDDISANLTVNNVFDKKYLNNVGFYNTGFYGAPAHAKLSVKATF
jgi:TonB-dependent siderophore receptor